MRMPMRTILAASIGLAAFGIGSFLVIGSGFLTPAPLGISQAAAEQSNTAAQQGFRTVSLRVENMNCASCPYIVRRSLEKVDGVKSAKVSFREKTAVVTFDPAKCSAKDLVAATAGSGFPSSVIR